jgi:hypothetical protein
MAHYVRITPGSMGVVSQALSLFPRHQVNPGTWGTPVRLGDITDDELEFVREFFAEIGCTVTEETADQFWWST